MEITNILCQSQTHISCYALRCAVELDISGHIKIYGGPMPLSELARSIPIPPEKEMMFGHLMALLIQKEIFAQNEAGYVLTPVSNQLVQTAGSNFRASVLLNTEPLLHNHLCQMSKWFKDGGRDTLFAMANNGKQFWDIRTENPEIGNLFDEAMASQAKHMMRDFVASYPHIFDGLTSLVDVGGGTGTTVKNIADAFPWLQCTVLDLPHVVAKALKDDSFNVTAGDMFEKIPQADAILLKSVLHNWGEDDCVRILKRCKEAIEPKKDGSKVIVMDIIMDLENTSYSRNEKEAALKHDVLMTCTFGSKERNKQEWDDLFMSAGYSSYKTYPARLGIVSVMELYP